MIVYSTVHFTIDCTDELDYLIAMFSLVSSFLAALDPRVRRARNLSRMSVQNGIRFFLLFGKKYCFIQKLRFLIDRLFGNFFQTPMLKNVFQLLEKVCSFLFLFILFKAFFTAIYTKLKSNLHRTTKIFTIKIKNLKIVAAYILMLRLNLFAY